MLTNHNIPPFSIDIVKTIDLFSKYMKFESKYFSKLTIRERKHREIFIIFANDKI